MYCNTEAYYSILVANQCTAETSRSLPLVERNSDHVSTKSNYISPPSTYGLKKPNHLPMKNLEPVESLLNADITQENKKGLVEIFKLAQYWIFSRKE